MTHDEMKHNISKQPGRKFVLELTHRHLSYTRRMPGNAIENRAFFELTVRERNNGKTDRFGQDKPEHYRMDALMLVKPGWSSLNQGKTFSVGIELKGERGDLISDEKFTHYRGWTNFLFFGVAEELLGIAEEKAEPYQDIGVFNIETGAIIKFPKFQTVPADKENEVMKQILFNYDKEKWVK